MKSTSSGQLDSADSPARPHLVARLSSLVGAWHFEGDVAATEHGPASRWHSEEHCEWLPGQCFLVNRWDAKVGDKPFRGMAVFGRDEESGFFATFYDDEGHHPMYLVTIDGDTWTLMGEAQRATYEFSANGQEVRVRWETKGDEGWQPLCDLVGRQARSH